MAQKSIKLLCSFPSPSFSDSSVFLLTSVWDSASVLTFYNIPFTDLESTSIGLVVCYRSFHLKMLGAQSGFHLKFQLLRKRKLRTACPSAFRAGQDNLARLFSQKQNSSSVLRITNVSWKDVCSANTQLIFNLGFLSAFWKIRSPFTVLPLMRMTFTEKPAHHQQHPCKLGKEGKERAHIQGAWWC